VDGISFTGRRLQAIAKKKKKYRLGYGMPLFVLQQSEIMQSASLRMDRMPKLRYTRHTLVILTYTANGQTQTVSVDGAQPFSVFQQDFDKALTAIGRRNNCFMISIRAV